MSSETAIFVKLFILIVVLVLLAFVVDFITRKLLLSAVHRFAVKSKTKFDDILLERKTFKYLAHIVPALLVLHLIPIVFHDFKHLILPLKEGVDIYLIVVFILLFQSVIRAGKDIIKERPAFRDKPVDSFAQLINIVNYLVGAILIFSEITGKPVGSFFAAMGAASAVLLLVFKDTILGFCGKYSVGNERYG